MPKKSFIQGFSQRSLRPTISQRHPKAGRLSSKSGPDMIISCGDQRLIGCARQCPTLAIWALRLGVPKVAPELLTWLVGVLVVASMGWCSIKLSQNPRWGGVGWCSKKLSQNPRWGGVPKVGVVLQKVVPESSMGWCWVVFQKVVPESSMGWCSKSWGGVPKCCPRILDGVVFQKLGWCSKKLSQNPHSVYYSSV